MQLKPVSYCLFLSTLSLFLCKNLYSNHFTDSTKLKNSDIYSLDDVKLLAKSNVLQANTSFDGIYELLEQPDLAPALKEQELKQKITELQLASASISEAEKALGNYPEQTSRARTALKKTEELISSITVLLSVDMDAFLGKRKLQTTDFELARLKQLSVKLNASMLYSQLTLTRLPEHAKSLNESFIETQKYLKKAEILFYQVYSEIEAKEVQEVDIKIIEQKLIEAHLALLRTQIIAGKDGASLSFESRKLLLETKRLIRQVQSMMFEFEIKAIAPETQLKELITEIHILLEWAKGSLQIGESKMATGVTSLPLNELTYDQPGVAEEKGLTQAHIIQAINVLSETQSVLTSALNMLPQNYADKTQTLELQVGSQRMLMQSLADEGELNESLYKTEKMLTQTQDYISSTKKFILDHPDTNITYRQYLQYFDVLLLETNEALKQTQDLIKDGKENDSNNIFQASGDLGNNGSFLKGKTIFFDDADNLVTSESGRELDELVDYMLKNPEINCLIICYPPYKAKIKSISINKRYKAASEYLIRRGVDEKRLQQMIYKDKTDKKEKLFDCLKFELLNDV